MSTTISSTKFDSQPSSLPARETPTDEKTRKIISWLMNVQYHAGIASVESFDVLSSLARSLPVSESDNSELLLVIEAIEALAHSKIYDPLLSGKASSAIDSFSNKLPSPIKVSSPEKTSYPQRSSEISRSTSQGRTVRRALFLDDAS